MAAKKVKEAYKPVSLVNRQARHEYDITETFEAGIALTGTEVKSIRQGRANLQDSFCRVIGGELWAYNLYVMPYEQGNRYNTEPRRPRKLLLHRWQINRLLGKVQEKGLAVIPTKLYFKQGYAKIEIGVGRGRKLYDKRDAIASREQERDARRELASRD